MTLSVRFLQCSGCRFDSPFWEGPAGWAMQRNHDLWQTFETVLLLCQSENVEFLFLTGDLFEQEYVRKTTVERVAQSLGRLKSTKIFIVPGEKDPFVATSAYRLAVWPSNAHIFSAGISHVKIPAQNVTVYGAGWTAYQQEKPFLEGFQVVEDGTIPLMLLHAEVASTKSTEGFIPLQTEHISSSGLSYLALGHQQKWTGIQKAGKTAWADSGVLEARGFSESGPHGVIIGEIGHGSTQFEFRELGQRRYIEKALPIQVNIESLASILLSETAPEERERDLFRIKLTGASANAEEVVRPLQRLLADTFRFIEVIYSQGETTSQLRPDFRTLTETTVGEERGYLTLTQIFLQKLQERQSAALSKADQDHWDLVRKIALTALDQGRIDDEN
ncbi:exonuclease SbcCD subunit D [Desulfosporosinus sp. SB140]|uniref:metallophosphoesterase family protein n=1 Tax=Desulfosporosinus paludis TaxID=3115649 RepID=UPI00388E895C